MTRISRISTPRATLAAFALLVFAMTGFAMFTGDVDSGAAATTAQALNEAVEHVQL